MGNRSRQTFLKRRKEKERMAKQRLKELRRRERTLERAAAGPRRPGVSDPDIDGIVAGPQEPIWERTDVLTEEELEQIQAEEEARKEAAARASGGSSGPSGRVGGRGRGSGHAAGRSPGAGPR